MIMDRLNQDIDVGHMDILSAKKLRTQLSKRISAIRVTDTIRLVTFVSAEKKTVMDIGIQWLYDNQLIKKKSKYAFLKFAVENTLKLILDEREKQEKIELQKIAYMSQIEPNLPTPKAQQFTPLK
uniref:Uncharacterized protein n=1 Tax=viral metagenome TaxID=1070528 RepID=A0A6M3M8I5_9ZZZZ